MNEVGGIHFEIPGEPIGKGRPRFVKATGRAFTPQKTRTFEAVVKDYGERAMGDRGPMEGPLRLILVACFLHPQSWSARKKEKTGWKTSKPDADNILKVMDALNKVVWIDDAQLVDVRITKSYASRASLFVTVDPVE